jgi:hypothetical protein
MHVFCLNVFGDPVYTTIGVNRFATLPPVPLLSVLLSLSSPVSAVLDYEHTRCRVLRSLHLHSRSHPIFRPTLNMFALSSALLIASLATPGVYGFFRCDQKP